MIAIKFKPVGKKHQGSFRVVVGEKRSKLRGVFIEDLGWYNPANSTYHVNKERAQYWISVGAQPTDTVHNLLVRGGVVRGKKIAVHRTAKKSAEEQSAEASKTVKAEIAETVPVSSPAPKESAPSEDTAKTEEKKDENEEKSSEKESKKEDKVSSEEDEGTS